MAETGMRAATPPAGEKGTTDKELQALKDAHAAIGRRLDALFGRGGGKHDAGRADDDEEGAQDSARSDEGEDDRQDARSDAGDRGKSMKDGSRKDAGAENFGGKQAPPFKAGDQGKHDAEEEEGKGLEKWAKEEKEEPEHKEGEDRPVPLAADKKDSDEDEDEEAKKDDDEEGGEEKQDAARSDARADARKDAASLRRRIEALERGATDEEIEALAEQQQLWSEPAMAHGERVSRPMHGESLLSYVRRNARHFQKYSDKWKGQDLRQIPGSMLQKIVAPEIRKDAVSAAYRPDPNAEPVLREVIKQDRTGRRISEFVGPVSAMLDQFRMPSFRVRKINTQPNPF